MSYLVLAIFGDRGYHHWKVRRCIKLKRFADKYTAEQRYKLAIRFQGMPTGYEPFPCVHCRGWHLLPPKFYWGERAPDLLARLPPLFVPPVADTMRYYPNQTRRKKNV